MSDLWSVRKDARSAARYESWRAWQEIDAALNRIAQKLNERITRVEQGARQLLALMLRGARERAMKAWRSRQSFFASRQAATLRQKHAHPAPVRKSSCGCHDSNGVRIRKASRCPSCRDGVVKVVCRTSGSGLVYCETGEGTRVSFADERTFRQWARDNGVRVEG